MENKDLLITILYDKDSNRNYTEALFFDITAALIRRDFHRSRYETAYHDGKIYGYMNNQNKHCGITILAVPFNQDTADNCANLFFIENTLCDKIKLASTLSVPVYRYNDKGVLDKWNID